jgi:metal-responsive CopG/Arc/MetJ family transcriptional regulator
MNNRIPDDEKRIKISISIDPILNKKVEKFIIDKKFYKKSRFIEFIIKKYIQENDN